MAVTVEQAEYVVLDESFRVVEVSRAAPSSFRSHLGKPMFDALPECEPLFRPHFERALQTRSPVDFATFYDGSVMRARVEPHLRGPYVSWGRLARLETRTLEALAESLETALATIAEIERELGCGRERLRLVRDDETLPPG